MNHIYISNETMNKLQLLDAQFNQQQLEAGATVTLSHG